MFRRRLRVEALERRECLDASALPLYFNAVDRFDVDVNGNLEPADAIAIINELNEHGSHVLLQNTAVDEFWNVNGDDMLTPHDAALTINRLNDQRPCTAANQSRRDAELLALEHSVAIVPPLALVDQIYGDLCRIREDYPVLRSVPHTPDWAPGQLIVFLDSHATGQFQAGIFTELTDLNGELGATSTDFQAAATGGRLLIHFAEQHNPLRLDGLYTPLQGVTGTSPNLLVGTADHIDLETGEVTGPERLSTYTFTKGWGDCQAGCISMHRWVFAVNDVNVTLVSESGDPLP